MFEDSGGKCWWESDARSAGSGRCVCVNETDMAVSSTYRAWVSRWSPNSWVSPSTTAFVHLPPPPLPHLPSPPLTPMSLFTHPLVCQERQHTTTSSTNTATPYPLHPYTLRSSSFPPFFLSPLSSSLEIWGARCNTFLFLLSSLSPGAFWFLLSPPLFLSFFHIPECFFSSVRLFRLRLLLKVSVCGIELWQSLFLKVLAH